MGLIDVWNGTLVYFGIIEDDDWDEDALATQEVDAQTRSRSSRGGVPSTAAIQGTDVPGRQATAHADAYRQHPRRPHAVRGCEGSTRAQQVRAPRAAALASTMRSRSPINLQGLDSGDPQSPERRQRALEAADRLRQRGSPTRSTAGLSASPTRSSCSRRGTSSCPPRERARALDSGASSTRPSSHPSGNRGGVHARRAPSVPCPSRGEQEGSPGDPIGPATRRCPAGQHRADADQRRPLLHRHAPVCECPSTARARPCSAASSRGCGRTGSRASGSSASGGIVISPRTPGMARARPRLVGAPALRRLAGEVDLQQRGHGEPPRRRVRVERVDELADAVHDLDLVRLQVADEVPAEGVPVDRVLRREILRPVLPDHLDARPRRHAELSRETYFVAATIVTSGPASARIQW